MIGRITKGALLGAIFVLAAGVWPANAHVSNVKVTSPSSNQVLAGSYGSDGTPSGFKHNLRGTASSDCSSFSSISFKVTGPSSYSKTFNYGSYSGKSFSSGPSTPWDTQGLRNGTYTVSMYATDTGGLLCNSDTGSGYITAKLADPPVAPIWNGSPSAASDGSANVTLSWNANPEPDMVEYALFREGPDGTKRTVVSATSPSPCTLSSGTYTCIDPASDFPTPYDGTYSYAIVALRSRPDFNSSETVKNCDTTNKPCVASDSSDVRQVTLTSPTPTPSPTDTPTGGGGGGGTTGGTTGGGTTGGGTTTTTGSSASAGGKKPSSVLSFGTSRGSSSYNDFYTGTYSEQLPYSPKTFIVGGGKKSVGGGQQVASGSLSNGPPNYRTIMLPVAGGLLAFLSAAHVRRLLLHF